MSGFISAHWDYAERAERRYKRIFWTLVLIYLVVGVIIPFIKLIGLEKGGGDEGKTRYAQMVQHQEAPIAQKEEEPKPQPEPTKEVEPPKPQKPVKPPKEIKQKPAEPTQQQQVQQARQVAQRSGLLAMADQLSDLRDRNLTQLDSSRPLTSSQSGGADNTGDASQAFSANAGSASGGITTSTPGNGQRYPNGTKLDQRKTTTVKTPVGFGRDMTKPGQNGDKLIAGRSDEEINAVFDRAKGAFNVIYMRAARENANLSAGVIVVSFTIAPDGSVSDCKLVSSSFGDAALEEKIVQRVKLLNFGAKAVPAFTVPHYPIKIQPS
jgi:TonB family protein